MGKFIHVTKDGKKIPLNSLEDSHLDNILRLIKKKAKEGVTVFIGGGCGDIEEMWADEIVLYGREAKHHMDYYKYKAEKKRRKKLLKLYDEIDRLL
jgi:hypothetical protein